MDFQPGLPPSTLSDTEFPGYWERTFMFSDAPPSLELPSDNSPVNLRPTPYPEAPLNGLDPMKETFPPSINPQNSLQHMHSDPIRRPSSSLSHLSSHRSVHHPYAQEPPTWNGPFSPLDLQFQADGRASSTCTSTSSMSELIDHSTNITRSKRALLHAPSQSKTNFQCKWAGCRSSRHFRREGDLIRHLRTIHISPAAFVCPDCQRSFGRKDHLNEHVKRRHGG